VSLADFSVSLEQVNLVSHAPDALPPKPPAILNYKSTPKFITQSKNEQSGLDWDKGFCGYQ